MKVEWKIDKLLAPLPAALVSCGTMKKANVLTVSWTGFLNSEPLMTYVAIRPSRYSYRLIKRGKSFVINIPNKKLLNPKNDYVFKINGQKISMNEFSPYFTLQKNWT